MTSFQLEDKFARLIERIWRPIDAEIDRSIVPNRISELGKIVIMSEPIEGPERDSERYRTSISNSAKTMRWEVRSESSRNLVFVTNEKLCGEVGFHFRFVRSSEEADNIDKFVIPWEIL